MAPHCADTAAEAAQYQTAFAHDEGLLQFVSHIAKILPDHATVLDIGCGTGYPVASIISAAGHKVLGIDFSDAMVQLCRTNVPTATFQVADMRTFEPNLEHPFDGILCILSLFLLSREEMEEMVEKWTAWVKPGGIIAVCTFPAEDLDPESKGAIYDEDGLCARSVPSTFLGARQEVTYFTRRGWQVLCESRGFEMSYTQCDTFVPPTGSLCDPEIHFFFIARRKDFQL